MDTSIMTEKKTRIVTLTGRPPVMIVEADWPIVARARQHDGKVLIEANRRWHLTVRQHADGRTLVYGRSETPTGWPDQGRAGGELLAKYEGTEVVACIRRVAADSGTEDIAAECIADLPAETL